MHVSSTKSSSFVAKAIVGRVSLEWVRLGCGSRLAKARAAARVEYSIPGLLKNVSGL